MEYVYTVKWNSQYKRSSIEQMFEPGIRFPLFDFQVFSATTIVRFEFFFFFFQNSWPCSIGYALLNRHRQYTMKMQHYLHTSSILIMRGREGKRVSRVSAFDWFKSFSNIFLSHCWFYYSFSIVSRVKKKKVRINGLNPALS